MPALRRRRPDRARPRRRSLLRRLLTGAALSLLAVIVLAVSFIGGLLSAPFPADAVTAQSGTIKVLDRDGGLLATLRPPQQQAPLTSYDQIAPCMISAITAAEDRRYFSHAGVDPLAILRAGYSDLLGDGRFQGGSTLTQQYVKLVYTNRSKTALRKIREAGLAVRLEQRKSKQEILRLYLNNVDFGNQVVGVEAAARYYFGLIVRRTKAGKTISAASQLSCAQASLIAGIVNAPSLNNPVASRSNAAARQRYVVQGMVNDKAITPEQASVILEKPTPIVAKGEARSISTGAPELTDLVTASVKTTLQANDLFSSGQLTIRTGVDGDLQTAAQTALRTLLPKATDPEAAVVAIDPRTGDVLALATKKDGGYHTGDLDLATQIARSTGSTIKPFTLATALENGYTLQSGFASRATISVPGCQTAHPHNDEPGGAYYTLATALAKSVNTIYAPLAADVGLTKVKALAAKAGLPAASFTGDRTCKVYIAHGLGVEVSPLDLVHAYTTLADHGIEHAPRFVTQVTETANHVDLIPPDPQPVGAVAIPTKIDDDVITAMRGVVTGGTGTGAAVSALSVFGKTGTTDGFANAWFVGCTPTAATGSAAAGATGAAPGAGIGPSGAVTPSAAPGLRPSTPAASASVGASAKGSTGATAEQAEPICLGVWMGYDDQNKTLQGVEGTDGFGGSLPASIFHATLTGWAANRTAKGLTAYPPQPVTTLAPAPAYSPPYRSAPTQPGSRAPVIITASASPAPAKTGGRAKPSTKPTQKSTKKTPTAPPASPAPAPTSG